MNEKIAWQNFLETGSVEDYLTYLQFKNISGISSINNAHNYDLEDTKGSAYGNNGYGPKGPQY